MKIRLRQTVGKRTTASREIKVWADDPADALRKAEEQARDTLIWEVRRG